MTPAPEAGGAAGGVPEFDVRLTPPDITPWIQGNTGIPGFTSLRATAPGPHVAVVALTHGNEIAGAIVLDRLLRQGVRPTSGTLTLGFANLAAFARFDPAHPTASRYLDEDLNRVWDSAVLDGQGRSLERDRARAMRPLIDTVDVLLDLHSMLWPSDPLILCGVTAKGRAMAATLPEPALVVADLGHPSGRRMIDYGPFADPDRPQTANLVEAGQHWQPETVRVTAAAVTAALHRVGAAPPPEAERHRFADVTHTVVAATSQFGFVQSYRGGDVIPRRNTLIALDGATEIRTQYDNCLLVMPSLRPSRGHTAVRLARFSEVG